MRVTRRTGGGRGVYEIAGQHNDYSASDLMGREMYIRLDPSHTLRTGIELVESGGKRRLRLSDGEMQIQRQAAALLLMPESNRADEALERGEPVMRSEAYALETVYFKDLRVTDDSSFEVSPGRIKVVNLDVSATFDFGIRLSRIFSLWSKCRDFPSDIAKLLCQHRRLVISGDPMPRRAESIVNDLQQSIAAHAGQLGIDFDGTGDPVSALDTKVPELLATALSAKPFVILSGASGTGKSQSALCLATAFDYGAALRTEREDSRSYPSTNAAFVPVEADWTDQRDILGYRNPFGPPRPEGSGLGQTNLTYEITSTLRLLLRASHPDYRHIPHFLILDEMNLSHVERYFSSFLSLMEAERSPGESSFPLVGKQDASLIADVLEHSGGAPIEAESARWISEESRGLTFSPNVHVIGTVNVDETTYMFSPKVLDRAFVIEMQPEHPSSYFQSGINEDGDDEEGESPTGDAWDLLGGQLSGEDAECMFRASMERRSEGSAGIRLDKFHEELKEIGISSHLANEIATSTQEVLSGSYDLMEPIGFAFGYRPANEITAFILEWVRLRQDCIEHSSDEVGDVWLDALDAAVFMKLLPKIHGNQRQLRGSLKALSEFYGGESSAGYQLGNASSEEATVGQGLSFKLKRSAAKATELHRRLQTHRYATFIS